MKKHLIVVAAAGLFSAHVFAVQPYIQAQLGQSEFDVDYSISEDSDTYLGVGVGFKVTQNLAFEIGYRNFGEAEDKYFDENFDYKETYSAEALSVAAVGILPVGPSVELFAKLGFDVWDAEWKGRATNGFETIKDKESDDGTDLFYAIGAAFNVNANTDIHLEYQRHSFEVGETDLDTDVLALGVNFGF